MLEDHRTLAQRIDGQQGRESRSETVAFRFTRQEQRRVEKAAQAQAMTVSEWARDVLLREARSGGTDALFSEVIALRMMLANLLKPVCCGQSITPEAFDAQLQYVRNTKQQMAREVRQQYAAVAEKEQ